ncbi:MAG: hypothetical protein VKK59_04455, partial [Vampirovibrionales bacterium]|nr:hypothetical protein [Vampirovibrionales bacterium]
MIFRKITAEVFLYVRYAYQLPHFLRRYTIKLDGRPSAGFFVTSLFSFNERSESVLDSTSPCAQEVCKTARSDDDRLKFVQECLQEKTSPAEKTPQTILIDRYEQSNSGISEEQWARHDVLLECISSENPNTTPLTSHDWLSYLKARPTPGKDWVLAQSATISQWLQSLERAQTYNKQIGQLNTVLYERNQRVEKELYTARQLQQSLLPTFLADNPHQATNSESLSPWQTQEPLIAQRSPLSKCHYNSSQLRVTGVYLPCDALGGDIYDVIQFPDGSMDVS